MFYPVLHSGPLPRRSSRQVKQSKSLVPSTLVLIDELSFRWSGNRVISIEIDRTGADR